ncbi:MAG: TonB-dependent receptor domain-containing protein [Burkholderiaceae bacterium]
MFQRTKICSGLLIAFGSSLLTVAPGAFAQDTTVQRVEITGSAIRRVDAETAVPVTVIKADELRAQGITSTEQILASISASQVQTTTAQVVGNNNGAGSFADIHALGSNKTLVLLNGHRLVNNAFNGAAPDLNMIPFAAVERVEVLRDGASSLYGTDAIAGVINFITRRDFNGGNIAIGMDAPQHPGGLQRDANLGFGFGDLDKNGINVFGFLDFGNSQRIKGTQRPFNTRQPGGLSPTPFPANYNQNAPFYGNPAAPACNSAGLTGAADSADTTSCQEATASFVDYTPRVERASGYAKATVKAFGDSTFSLEGFLSHDHVQSQIAPVPYGGLAMNPFMADGVTPNPYYPGHALGPTPTIPLSPTYFPASHPTGAQPGYIKVKWRDLSHGPRTDSPVNDQFRILAALEGTAGDWNYSVDAMMSENTVHDVVTGYSDGTIITPAMLNGLLNPWTSTQSAAGQAVINNSAAGGLLQVANATLYSVDAHGDRELGDWFHAGRAATIAVGAEARDEKMVDHANRPVAERLVASTGLAADFYQAGSRRIYAGFVEMNVPVMKSLDFTLAARYDHYSDFGSTTNPKVSFRFEPVKAFLMRGSFSTGFRAPTLYDLNQAPSYGTPGTTNDPLHSTVDANGDCHAIAPFSSTDVCNIQPEVLNGGTKSLKPEKSKNASLGFLFEPSKDFTFGVDAYRVSYTNQITSLSVDTLTDPGLYTNFTQYYHRNAEGLLSTDGSACPGNDCGYLDTLTKNLGGVITNGLDFSSTFKANLGSAGTLNFDYSSTWVHKFALQNYIGDSYHNNVGVYFDGAPVFRWTHNGSLTWQLKPFTVGLAAHYKSGYVDAEPSNKVKAYSTMDAYLGWSQGAKGFSAIVGVRNLFDRDPPFSNQQTVFQANYDPRFADPTGRTFYGRLGYSF